MKNMGEFKRCRLLVLLSVSTVALSLVGYLGKNNVYAGNSVDLIKSPQLAVVFEGMEQGKYPWDMLAFDSKQANATVSESSTPAVEETAASAETTAGGETAASAETSASAEATVSAETTASETEGSVPGQESSAANGETSSEVADKSVENKAPVEAGEKKREGSDLFATVDESYFDDALFIGDSRTVGLSQYSGWKNPVYYANVGLTIYDVFDKNIAEVNGETLTIDKALEKKKFGKIYIMLGINELGRGTTQKFADRYSQVIGRIRELQPDAVIFIEGIMHVSKKKSDTDPIFNNKNIEDRNAAIEKLADNSTIFYIDVNQAITDDTGGIPADYTFDNVHLKAAYYNIWTNFLLAHGIIRNP
jgi:hypothetical protein